MVSGSLRGGKWRKAEMGRENGRGFDQRVELVWG